MYHDDGDSDDEEFTNPLLIPELLSQVLAYLNLSDLCACRIVSKSWNIEASNYVGKKKTIILSEASEVKRFLNTAIDGTRFHSSAQELQVNPFKNISTPYRIFEFRNLKISLDDQDTENFFILLGPFMYKLIFNYDTEIEAHLLSIRDFRDIFLFYATNIESLDLLQLPSLDILERKYIFPPWVNMQEKFTTPLIPTLRKLSLSASSDYNSEFLENFFEACPFLEKIEIEFSTDWSAFFNFREVFLNVFFNLPNLFRRIKSFTFFIYNDLRLMWDNIDCKRLTLMNLKLEELSLHLTTGEKLTETIYELLNSIRYSLVRLKLRIESNLVCPPLDRLVCLKLNEYRGTWKFLDNCPSLRELHFLLYSPPSEIVDEIAPSCANQLVTLNMNHTTPFSSQIFLQIAKKLPNLRSLKWMHIDDEILHAIFGEFPLLEKLCINIAESTNWGLTGIPLDIISSSVDFLNGDLSLNEIENLRTGPFIGNLKHLRRLELHGSLLGDWKFSKISDISFIYGICCLPQLTFLSLVEFGHEITEESLIAIGQNLKLLTFVLDQRLFSELGIENLRSICPGVNIEFNSNLLDETENEFNTYGIPPVEPGLECFGPYGCG